MTDNLVFGATNPAAISSSLPNSHGAITGRPFNTTTANNYYTACSVAGNSSATGIGSSSVGLNREIKGGNGPARGRSFDDWDEE